MKKIINAIVLVSAALLFSVAGMAQAETLRIATEGAYPPFNYID